VEVPGPTGGDFPRFDVARWLLRALSDLAAGGEGGEGARGASSQQPSATAPRSFSAATGLPTGPAKYDAVRQFLRDAVGEARAVGKEVAAEGTPLRALSSASASAASSASDVGARLGSLLALDDLGLPGPSTARSKYDPLQAALEASPPGRGGGAGSGAPLDGPAGWVRWLVRKVMGMEGGGGGGRVSGEPSSSPRLRAPRRMFQPAAPPAAGVEAVSPQGPPPE
jgi:hypothetical protein